MRGVGFAITNLKESLFDAAEIQTGLPKSRRDQSDFAIARHEEIQDAVVGVDRFFDARDSGLLLRRSGEIEGERADARSGNLDIAHFWMRDGQNLPGIYPWRFQKVARDAVDLVEGSDGINIALFDFDGDDQDIRRSEHPLMFFREKGVGVIGRNDVTEVHLDLGLRQVVPKHERDERRERDYGPTVTKQGTKIGFHPFAGEHEFSGLLTRRALRRTTPNDRGA